MSESIQEKQPLAKSKVFTLNRDPIFWRDLSFYFFVYFTQAIISYFTLYFASELYRDELSYDFNQISWIILLTYLPLLFKPKFSKIFTNKPSTYLKYTVILGIILNFIGFIIISLDIVYSTILLYIPVIFIALTGSVLIDSTADTVFVLKYKEQTSLLSWIQQIGSILGSLISTIIYANTVGTNAIRKDWGIFLFIMSFVMFPLVGWLFFKDMFKSKIISADSNKITNLKDKQYPDFKNIIKTLSFKEKKVIKLFIFLLIGLNASYLVGTLNETIIIDRFGTGGFTSFSEYWAVIGSTVKLVFLVLLVFFLPLIRKKAFFIIVCTGIYSIVYLSLIPILSLTGIGILYVIYSPLGLIFGIAWIALMIELTPKQFTAWWYQIFALVVLLTRIIFEFVGLRIAHKLGAAPLFYAAAVLILITLPILIKVMKLKSLPE
ncbi:hypothetical protein NEF87_003484 [Candidatus Lokiarchaeum ossiferum]|uniref:MFS transporter n=1 Tax=Candidatus Lokiarchaeum ossiferum TaxID=2951803 RepID=A0ABY6HUJ9_9ARCH|nr:hypothetical protein NEF87_003484 [Candidatus Lokiarchaeum sp. B-35]